MATTTTAADLPVPAADRPNPIQPSAKIISARDRAAQPQTANRPGKVSGDRRAAAIKALGKLQGAEGSAKPKTGRAIAESATPAASSSSSSSSSSSTAVDDDGVGDILAAGGEPDPEPGSPDERRVHRQKRREEASKRLKDFDTKAAERRRVVEQSQAESRKRQELERREKEIERELTEARLAREKPIEFLERSGIPAKKVVELALKETDPTLQEKDALERELAHIRSRLDTDAKAREDWKKEEEARAFRTKVESFEKPFTSFREAPKKFPVLQKYARDYVQQRCRIVAQKYIQETGVWPGTEGAEIDQSDILLYVQDQLIQEEEADASEAGSRVQEPRREGPKPAATIGGSLGARSGGSQHRRRLTREERVERAKAMIRVRG